VVITVEPISIPWAPNSTNSFLTIRAKPMATPAWERIPHAKVLFNTLGLLAQMGANFCAPHQTKGTAYDINYTEDTQGGKGRDMEICPSKDKKEDEEEGHKFAELMVDFFHETALLGVHHHETKDHVGQDEAQMKMVAEPPYPTTLEQRGG
jgi:hypothetical protein